LKAISTIFWINEKLRGLLFMGVAATTLCDRLLMRSGREDAWRLLRKAKKMLAFFC
jgi:hypothetical protein